MMLGRCRSEIQLHNNRKIAKNQGFLLPQVISGMRLLTIYSKDAPRQSAGRVTYPKNHGGGRDLALGLSFIIKASQGRHDH